MNRGPRTVRSAASDSVVEQGPTRPPPDHAKGLVLDESLEVPPPQRVTELPERFGLDLPDALAGHGEPLADLFQRVLALFADAEAQPEDLLLLRGEGGEGPLDLSVEVLTQQRVVGRTRGLVLEEVAQLGILSDRSLQRQWLPRRF